MRLDIKSAMTDAEADRLAQLAIAQDVLEVGALLGHGTVAMALTARSVVSVDPHAGYPEHNPRPTLAPFLENLERHGVRGKVTPIIGMDHEVLPRLAPRQFGVAFVDLTGYYEDTRDCIRRVIPLLRHHAVLAVHDCGRDGWPGVMQAVEELGRPWEQVDTLSVFEGTWG
jgi:predicted O-methyltransferase YrrM